MTTVVMDRFRSKVKAKPNGCWEWHAYRNPQGYGKFGYGGKIHLAHRFIFYILFPDTNPKYDTHHLCDNPACVNPSHLVPVSRASHMDLTPGSAVNKERRKTSCPAGHNYDDKNTQWYRGSRLCKTCHKSHNARYRLKRKAMSNF